MAWGYRFLLCSSQHEDPPSKWPLMNSHPNCSEPKNVSRAEEASASGHVAGDPAVGAGGNAPTVGGARDLASPVENGRGGVGSCGLSLEWVFL